MNIQDLIEALTDIAGDYPDAVVRLAVQPPWPFQHTIADVIGPRELDAAAGDVDPDDTEGDDPPPAGGRRLPHRRGADRLPGPDRVPGCGVALR